MNIQIPTTPLNLDTSTHIHATDENGVKLIDPETGKPVHIAQDLTTGQWFRKIAGGKPGDIVGAVHHASRDEKYRGVWVPIAPATVRTRGGGIVDDSTASLIRAGLSIK